MLIALLALAAVLCSGLNGTVGGVSQTLAGKLTASVQFLQRQGGPSPGYRLVHRELPAGAVERKVAAVSQAVVKHKAKVEVHDVKSAEESAPPQSWHRTVAPSNIVTETRQYLRHRSPPSRAPPFHA
jgi:hypothetical protein